MIWQISNIINTLYINNASDVVNTRHRWILLARTVMWSLDGYFNVKLVNKQSRCWLFEISWCSYYVTKFTRDFRSPVLSSGTAECRVYYAPTYGSTPFPFETLTANGTRSYIPCCRRFGTNLPNPMGMRLPTVPKQHKIKAIRNKLVQCNTMQYNTIQYNTTHYNTMHSAAVGVSQQTAKQWLCVIWTSFFIDSKICHALSSVYNCAYRLNKTYLCLNNTIQYNANGCFGIRGIPLIMHLFRYIQRFCISVMIHNNDGLAKSLTRHLLLTWFNFNPSIDNIYCKILDEITYSFPHIFIHYYFLDFHSEFIDLCSYVCNW